jgi:hypothetical protein
VTHRLLVWAHTSITTAEHTQHKHPISGPFFLSLTQNERADIVAGRLVVLHMGPIAQRELLGPAGVEK